MRVLELWLNGEREYFTGIVLLKKFGAKNDLANTLLSKKNNYNITRLEQEIRKLISPTLPTPAEQPPTPKQIIETEVDNTTCANVELYEVSISEATKAYKEAMNMRAELFALCRVESWEDPNLPNNVQIRSRIAVDVVTKYNYASKLYDRAEHVRKVGRLPDNEEENHVNDYANLPDVMVKQTLDNLRKNYNKIRKREHTAERTALMQRHQANITYLENKWDLIKST